MIAVCGLVLGAMFGCGRPRPTQQIIVEQAALPQLYMSAKGNRRIEPGNKGAFVDATTGEKFYRAVVCANPNCPGRSNAEPFLFVVPDDRVDECPECAKPRRGKKESPEEKARYSSYIQHYILPESRPRYEQLQKELERSMKFEWDNRRRP